MADEPSGTKGMTEAVDAVADSFNVAKWGKKTK